MAIIGAVCLGIGYYIALTTDSPLAALNLFFIAVVFVIMGTYFLFVAGSVALLKMLRKNKVLL
jgi:putative ABC transport system permease protein